MLTSVVLKSQILPRRGWQLGGKTVNMPQFLHLSNKATVACSNLSLDVQQPSENDYEQKEQGPNFHHWKQEGSNAVIRNRLTLQPGNKINSQQGFLTAATPGNAAAAWLGEGHQEVTVPQPRPSLADASPSVKDASKMDGRAALLHVGYREPSP